MSLEQKLEALTEAVEKLTAKIASATVNVTNNTTAATTADDNDKPESTRAEKAAAKKAAAAATRAAKAKPKDEDDDDDDDFGDDDAGAEDDDDAGESAVTADQIRDLLMKVKEKKDAAAARAILSEVGVKTIAQIAEKQYPKVIALAKKVGVSL